MFPGPAWPPLYELVGREFGEAARRLSPVAYTVDDGRGWPADEVRDRSGPLAVDP